MKKIYIMICGLPGSGKTTTATFLKEWLKEQHPELDAKILSMNRLANLKYPWLIDRMKIGALNKDEEYKVEECYFESLAMLLNDDKTDIIIDDNLNLNTFVRKWVLDNVGDKAVVGAINMNRNIHFCEKHIADHVPPTPRAFLYECSRRYQQPIYEEDFWAIHNVDEKRRLNDNNARKFMERMFRYARVQSGMEENESK